MKKATIKITDDFILKRKEHVSFIHMTFDESVFSDLYNCCDNIEDKAERLYCLSFCYLKGIGIKVDESKFIELLTEAANNNHPDALFNLADLYYTS